MSPAIGKDARLVYKGVVYNEMKGAMSSPDQVMVRSLLNALYPDTTYSNNSGGEPAGHPIAHPRAAQSVSCPPLPSEQRLFLHLRQSAPEGPPGIYRGAGAEPVFAHRSGNRRSRPAPVDGAEDRQSITTRWIAARILQKNTRPAWHGCWPISRTPSRYWLPR